MKKFTKLLGIVLIMALVMSMGITSAFASTITINQNATADQGTAGAETYVAYKIFDVTKTAAQEDYETTAAGPGTEEGFAYTIDANSAWVDVVEDSGYFDLTLSAEGDLYTVTLKDPDTDTEANENNTAEKAKEIAEYFKAHIPSGIVECNPTADGYDATAAEAAVDKKYTFVSNGTTASVTVDDGYYMITSTLGTNLIAATSDITMTTKNEYVVDQKVVEKASVTVGENATYYIEVYLPATIDTTLPVVVHDVLDEHLKFNNDVQFVVSTTDPGSTAADYKALTYADLTDAYSVVTEANVSEAAAAATDDTVEACTFEINITTTGLAGKYIVFKYSAELLSTAVNDTGYVNKEFSTYSEYTTKPSNPEVKTYDFNFTKVDGDAAKLDGAKFELYAAWDSTNNEASGDPISFLKPTDTAKTTYKKADTQDAAAEAVEKVTEIVVNSKTDNAATVISGLGGADDTTGTNYYLVETEAPSGFNKLTAPIIVNVKDNGTITVSLNGETLDSASDAFNVENNSGTVLPSTGGIGTTIFYVVGSILVVAAGVLLITKKRMSREG